MAIPMFDLDADEQLRNLSKRHLENVSSFLSTLLTNNKNTSRTRANQNERRLWTYAKSRLFQLQGSKNTSEIGKRAKGRIASKGGSKVTCPKCPNPALVSLVNVKKFLRGPGKSKSILRLTYECDLCRSVVRRKVTLFKNSKVTYDPSTKSEDAFKSNRRQSSSLLINTSSSPGTKLPSNSPSFSNLNKLLLRRRSGVDAKTGLLDFLLECNKK